MLRWLYKSAIDTWPTYGGSMRGEEEGGEPNRQAGPWTLYHKTDQIDNLDSKMTVGADVDRKNDSWRVRGPKNDS
jgi:hypothetical protein